MSCQTVFKRYEFKYVLTKAQEEKVLSAIMPYMESDSFGRTTVRNIYFDTENFRLIRNSIEKPVYKEKLRIRSYKCATPGSNVFVELKKKYDHIVYKRRIVVPERTAMDWLCYGKSLDKQSQISKEIDYFMSYYGTLKPAVFLSYERVAYRSINGSDLRITFDSKILFRREQISLEADVFGTPLLEKDAVLMEIKCSGGFPVWLVRLLSEENIYKTSFSKYGKAYKTMLNDLKKTDTKEIKTNA